MSGDIDVDVDATIAERVLSSWRELRRGAAATPMRSYLNGVSGAPLDQAQLDTLEILGGRPDGWRMSELADALRIDPSTATRSVDRLAGMGYAERLASDGDRRIVIARATNEGRRVYERAMRVRTAGIEQLLSDFSADEQAEFAEYLERFVASLDTAVRRLGDGR